MLRPNLLRAALPAALLTLAPLTASALECPDTLPPLPPDIAELRQEVVEISLANLDLWGDPAIEAELEWRVEILADWFADNRPANEIELTQQSWRTIWYEDPSILFDMPPIVVTDRDNNFQVVRDGFYYNTGRLDISLIPGVEEATVFLKGEYTLKDLAGPDTCGQQRRNVVDLEFTTLDLIPTWLPSDLSLNDLIDTFDSGVIPSRPIPFPEGQTGDLWNLFIDEDVRIAFGGDDDEPISAGALFILIRQDFINE